GIRDFHVTGVQTCALPISLILASFGTATTIDTLVVKNTDTDPGNAVHQYQFPGGLILPGPALMRTSLAENTAHLPDAHSSATIRSEERRVGKERRPRRATE